MIMAMFQTFLTVAAQIGVAPAAAPQPASPQPAPEQKVPSPPPLPEPMHEPAPVPTPINVPSPVPAHSPAPTPQLFEQPASPVSQSSDEDSQEIEPSPKRRRTMNVNDIVSSTLPAPSSETTPPLVAMTGHECEEAIQEQGDMAGFDLSKQGIENYSKAVANEAFIIAGAETTIHLAKHDARVGRSAQSLCIWAQNMRTIAKNPAVRREVRQGSTSSKKFKH